MQQKRHPKPYITHQETEWRTDRICKVAAVGETKIIMALLYINNVWDKGEGH